MTTERVLRFDDRPTTTAQLIGEFLGRKGGHHLLLGGLSPGRRSDCSRPVGLCVEKLRYERICLVASELAASLTLGEPHRAACIAEVRMACALEEVQELSHLLGRCRWA
jgi:hypothetical protein